MIKEKQTCLCTSHDTFDHCNGLGGIHSICVTDKTYAAGECLDLWVRLYQSCCIAPANHQEIKAEDVRLHILKWFVYPPPVPLWLQSRVATHLYYFVARFSHYTVINHLQSSIGFPNNDDYMSILNRWRLANLFSWTSAYIWTLIHNRLLPCSPDAGHYLRTRLIVSLWESMLRLNEVHWVMATNNFSHDDKLLILHEITDHEMITRCIDLMIV